MNYASWPRTSTISLKLRSRCCAPRRGAVASAILRLRAPSRCRRMRRHRMRRQCQPLPTLNQSPAPNTPVFTLGILAACPSSFQMSPAARTRKARTTTRGRPSSATAIPMNKRRNSLQPCCRPESKTGFNRRANSAAAIRASWSPPISSMRRMLLRRGPFHPRSSQSLRPKPLTSPRLHAPIVVRRIRSLKAWTPSTPGNVINAARSGSIQSRQSPQRRVLRPHNPHKRKEPPGNRAALSSGRIVPTEPNPLELSGCILGAGEGSVKRKCL